MYCHLAPLNNPILEPLQALSTLDDLRRCAHYDRKSLNIPSYNAACTYDGTLAYRDTRQHNTICPNPTIFADPHGRGLMASVKNPPISPRNLVVGRQYLSSITDQTPIPYR